MWRSPHWRSPFLTASAWPIQLGLRANLVQFVLLVVINAFVGATVGIERSIVPLLGQRTFALASTTAILSFIASFGLVKALANLLTGRLSDQIGRKQVLLLGWLAGLPVPLLLLWAPSWGWVIGANLLLGLNQGLCWSTTVNMKIDLAGPRRRGLAMGINEAAGYGAVAVAAVAAGYLAAQYGLRPAPLLLELGCVLAGSLLSVVGVRESQGHATQEATLHAPTTPPPTFATIVRVTSWENPTLFAISQAGLVNNLNDGVAWGILPLFFAAQGLPLAQIGLLVGLYPAVWGVAQLGTGALSDRWGRKRLIVAGMGLQGLALIVLPLLHGFGAWALTLVVLGVGTALVYPTLLAAIADVVHPTWRASAVGVYRGWRDSGYVFGAVLAGGIADRLGMGWAIAMVGVLTVMAGGVAHWRMCETLVPTGTS